MNTVKTLSLFLLLAAAGCVATQKTAGENVDDTWIHTKVKSALVGEGSSNINVEVYQATVQLAGFVDSEAQREKAGQVAAAVTGVKEVSNQLAVQTSTRTAGQALDDGIIASKVKTRLAGDEQTSGIDINVEVRNGVVLLSGFVTSDEERDQAIGVAGSVKGVSKVVNGMDLVPRG